MHSLLTSEDRAYRDEVVRFAREELAPLAERLGEVDDVPAELRELLARAGVYRHVFPEAYGGAGTSAVRICLAREALAGVYGPADTTLAMQGLGGYPVVLAGTDEQKARWLPDLAAGRRLATFCLTEPDAGSDVAAMTATAELRDGVFRLNGCKRFISNGHSADLGVVFARDPGAGERGISAFVVEKGMEGFRVASRMELIASHDIVELEFADCRVPAENLLGPRGEGFKLAMRTLDLMRMSVGAAAVGMAEAACREALAYARKRVQFGKPLAKFQAVSFKLAEMAVEIETSRALVYLAALKRDRGDPQASLASSMAKLHATEAAFRAIDQAVQVHGGVGVVKGSAVERLYREIRPLRIYEGTTDIQKLIIANHLLKG